MLIRTFPFCKTQVTPPPPSCRSHLSTLNLTTSSLSKALQTSPCIFIIINSILVFISSGRWAKWSRGVMGRAMKLFVSIGFFAENRVRLAVNAVPYLLQEKIGFRLVFFPFYTGCCNVQLELKIYSCCHV